jgi:CheY-like chemotaxis protein
MALNTEKLSIVLVEDNPLLRDIVLENLDSIEQVIVVATADRQIQALNEIEEHKPNLVIADLELNEGNGLGVLNEINRHPELYGTPEKLVLTNHTSKHLKKKCLEQDIQGFYDKSYQLFEMMDWIEEAAKK